MFRKLGDCKSRRIDIGIEIKTNSEFLMHKIYLSSSGTQIYFCATTWVLTLFIDAVTTALVTSS
jgi:hypothetical protein